jgi:PII-like signaling protein
MKLEGEQTLLRVYLRNTDKYHLTSAGDALVQRGRDQGLAGATVLRGFFGLDINGQLLETKFWSVVEHAPVIVEFVDSPRIIGAFLAAVAELVPEGLATLERAHVLVYRQNRAAAERARMRLDGPGPQAPFAILPSPEEFPIMKLSEEGQLLRIFIGESDVWKGQALYRAIVLKVRELGLAGATVLRGPMGFGANSRVHTTKLLELSTDLPIVIEIVDNAAKIQGILPFLDEAVSEGLITVEGVRVLKYRHNPDKARQGAS